MTNAGSTLICADYEEDESPATIAAAQKTAEELLNGAGAADPTVPNYSLGLDPALLVAVEGGGYTSIASVGLGTILTNGSRVVGIIHEECAEVCSLPRSHCVVAAAQLVHDGDKWTRATHLWPSRNQRQILIHLMLDSQQSFYIYEPFTLRPYHIRDYTEVADPAMQTPYDAALQN